MVYPLQYEVKVGFDLVRQLVKDQCAGQLGQQFVDKLQPVSKFETIQKLTHQTAEMVKVLGQGADFTFTSYYNILPLLRKAEIEGTFLEPQEWVHIRDTVASLTDVYQFFAKQPAEEFPELKALGGYIVLQPGLPSRIGQVIDDNGQVRDSASTELQQIRRTLIKEQTGLRRKLESLLKYLKSEDMVADDAELTIRSGRLVIPLRAEQKRQIKGLIHDESATGQTVYIEPAEVVELNNAIRELEYEERREIVRILTQLTNYLRPLVPNMVKACTYLGMMDFIRAKARFAMMTESVLPNSQKIPGLDWKGAKHPLLQLSLARQGRKVVPFSLKLDQQDRVLVISGPNAGGKSIALKTIGLVQYMWQCGMLVPMNEASTMGVFDSLLIDIGDEQSLENDLSTYSSHLKHMLYFVNRATKKTLFLIDEMGTGTEPQYGGAIAEAILEELVKQQALGVVNTHYGNLKDFADRTKGVLNGAMRFDANTLSPLYQLEIGKPGSSFALEIARKIGFGDQLLKKAASKVGFRRVNYDQLLLELEAQKQQYEVLKVEAQKQQEYHSKYAKDYQDLKALLDGQKKQQLDDAKVQAKQLVKEANRKIEETIKAIREGQAEKELTKKLRQDLQQFAEVELQTPEKPLVEPESTPLPKVDAPVQSASKSSVKAASKSGLAVPKPSNQDAKDDVVPTVIEVGSFVQVQGSGAFAQVISLVGKDAEISIGALKSKVKVARLRPVSKSAFKEATGLDLQEPAPMKGIDLNRKMADFSFQLDIRGMRAVEAIAEIDQFMDSALLLGQQDLRILHGKGDGVLRNLVRQQLRGYRQVAGMEDEHADRGGDGITLVRLKG